MNTTPRKNDRDFQDSEMISTSDIENSPFITVRDYQTHVSKLSNENFTLKLLLFELQKEFRMFLKSRNVQDDIIDLVTNQKKYISTLTAEIGQNSELANSSNGSRIPPESPTLKQQLTRALDDNLQLMNELKEKEHQQYDNVVESSILFDDGAQANINNLELNNKIKELLRENESLNQKVNSLSNDIGEYQKENNDLLQKVTNLTQALKKQQDLDDHLADAQNIINELESKNAQLEKDHINFDDMNNVVSQLEELSKKNNQLMDENIKLKEDNEQLKDANDKLNDGNSKLMIALSVLDFRDVLPKIEALIKENADLQKQNNQLNEQLMRLTSNNRNTSELKDQIFNLNAEIQKLKLQLQHQKEMKADDYDELVMKNHNLKGKKRAIQSSINRLNSGNNNNSPTVTSTSFSPRKKIESPTNNIDSLWNDAKIENEKLTKDVDDLYSLLNEKLNSKINSLMNELNKVSSLQKKNDELQKQNDSLLRDLDNLQNENLSLAQQIEVIKGEYDDLTNEIDNLRRQPRFNTMATTPIRFSLNNVNNSDDDKLIIDDLKNQIELLQLENNQLKNLKSSEIEALKSENQKLLHDQIRTTPVKRENGQLKNESQELRNALANEEAMRMKLLHGMNEILNTVDDRINAFIDDFDECFKGMANNFQRFIGIILALARSVNSGNRQQVQELAQFGSSIINDMKKGANICLSNCKGIKFENINNPLISREDRKKLTMLQKKYDTPVVGDLARFIKEENERSMLNNNQSLLNNQIDSFDINKCIGQLQLVIHSIWKEFGNGRNEPQISSLLQWKVNGDSITQNAVDLFSESIKNMKELISRQKKIIETGGSSGSLAGLSPQVVNLLKLVRNDINRFSKQMSTEHQELIEEVAKKEMLNEQ